MARIIKADGRTINDYDYAGLEAKQKAVGGWIEPVYTSDLVILVNEEGHLENLPMNLEVSAMCGRVIVGDCLVMTHKEWSSEN